MKKESSKKGQPGNVEEAKSKLQIKVEEELQVVETMVSVSCHGKKHERQEGEELCTQCQALLDYAKIRSMRCPRKEEKTFCNTCPIHCYKPEHRQAMKEVMKYAGPRMLYKHPIVAIKHVINSLVHKWREKKKKKETGERS